MQGASKSKASAGAHLRQLAKTKGVDPEKLVEERMEGSGAEIGFDCPPELEWHFHAFLGLSRKRSGGGFGANPLAWSEVESWARLCRIELLPWEVDVLMALDEVWLEVQHGRSGATGNPHRESAGGKRQPTLE